MTAEEQAAADAAALQQQQQSVADYKALTGGRFESPEQVTEFFGKFDTEYIPATKVSEEYIPKTTAYANDFVKEINTLIQNDAPAEKIATFISLSTKDVNALDAKEVILLKSQLENDWTREDAELMYNKKYPSAAEIALQKGITEDAAASEFRLLEIERKTEEKKAKAFLLDTRKGILDGVKTKDQQVIEQTTNLANAKTAWEGSDFAATTATTLKTIPISVKDDEAGIDFTYDVPVPAEYIAAQLPKAIELAAANGLKITPENVGKLQGMMKDAFIAENFATIAESIVRDVTSKVTATVTAKFENPGKIIRTGADGKPIVEGEKVKERFYGGS